MSVERTIEPCPMKNCDREILCTVSRAPRASGWCVMCDCGYRSQAYSSPAAAIDAHNELYELVEKGRKYDALHDLSDEQAKIGAQLIIQRDEGVKLLRRAKNRISIAHESRCSIDLFLAREDIKKIGG